MKMNFHCFENLIPIMILALFLNSGLINATEVGKRTDPLEASAWNESKWISAVDAPVVKGHNNGRAADGASWFVSTVKNEQKIVSAKWMTAGLGVYELYVNGKPVGGEFLKPGFTHYAKTKRSFTYDNSEFSVEELSSYVGMSRGHLYKKLIMITGKSPLEFIRILRVKRGKQLLEQSQLNVSQIAYQIGLSPKQFAKYFKEEFGYVPSEYIKNNNTN
jgi:AraC-like DNA-binding protein